MDGERKCFQMVGGVLCERTVKDVLPIVVKTQAGVRSLIQRKWRVF